MTLKNYFRIKLELSRMILDDTLIEAKFNYISMSSDDGDEEISFQNRKTYFQPEKNTRNMYLLIQNDGTSIRDRIDYLMDEDFFIEELNLSITFNETQKISYEIKEVEQLETVECYGEDKDIVDKILNFEEVNNTICIVGPKPDKMYGYNMKDAKYEKLVQGLMKRIEAYVQTGKNIILTNGYIGGETLGFEAGKRLKAIYPEIMNVVAVPFLNLDAKWPSQSKTQFKQMIAEADAFIEIDKVKHYTYNTPEIYAKEKFVKKNDFNLDHAGTFFLIQDYDGSLSTFRRRLDIENKFYEAEYYDFADESVFPFDWEEVDLPFN